MKVRLFLMLAAALVSSGECVQVGPPKPLQYGRVEVSAFSFIEERIPTAGFSLTEKSTQKGLRRDFRNLVAEKIPYGTYILRVSAPGFRSVEREVRVDQANIALRVQLAVSAECGEPAEIAGSVNPAPADRELWVKVLSVRGSASAETRVGRDGGFFISGLDDGDFFLFVLDEKKIVATRTLQIAGRQRINIDLK